MGTAELRMNLQPRLVGELLELRPVRPDDWDELFAAAADPLIWEVHPSPDRYKEESFRKYFQGALDSGGALVAIDRASGSIVGSSRYHGYDEKESVIEIGFTFLARAYWGGKHNGDMKRLMLDHAFRFVENVTFRVGIQNLRSRRAVEKIGGVLTGRTEMVDVNGTIVEHVIYRITRHH
jgi:RimJ/RimL family protein N-acetyltransferase